MRLLLTVPTLLGLFLAGCASGSAPMAGAEIQSITDIMVCDQDLAPVRGARGEYQGLQLGCALNQRPGQMLIVQESPSRRVKLQNDAHKNGFFKVGDRVIYPAESIWSRHAADLPWIKLAPP